MYCIDGSSAEEWRLKLFNSYNIGKNSQYLRIRSAKDKGRIENRNRLLGEALTYPYIQPNSHFNLRWLVFDIDREFDLNEVYDKNIPEPNLIVYNTQNGHAHIWYGLKSPIYHQKEFKKSKPLKYAQAIYNSLCRKLSADIHFNRNLCKNPLHSEWNTIVLREEYYSLGELASHLDINWNDEPNTFYKKAKKILVDNDISVEFDGVEKGSRNSELFDFVRKISYRYRKTANCTEDEFIQWCIETVRQADRKNPQPLADEGRGEKEIEQIGKSIGEWTWSNIDPCKVAVPQYNDEARARSLAVRRKNAQKKVKKIARMLKKNPNLSNRELSRQLGTGFSLDTVNRIVRKIEENKKLKAEKSKKSRHEVVGLVPSDILLAERLVNQVVEPGGSLLQTKILLST